MLRNRIGDLIRSLLNTQASPALLEQIASCVPLARSPIYPVRQKYPKPHSNALDLIICYLFQKVMKTSISVRHVNLHVLSFGIILPILRWHMPVTDGEGSTKKAWMQVTFTHFRATCPSGHFSASGYFTNQPICVPITPGKHDLVFTRLSIYSRI